MALFGRIFGLIGFLNDFFHGLEVLGLQIFAYLFDNIEKGSVLVLIVLFGLLVHLGDELNKRVLYFSRSIGKNHHDKIPHQILPIVKTLRSLVVHYPRIMKLTKPTKVHRNLIIQTHQLRRLVKVLQVLMMIQHLNKPLHQLTIDIHGVLIKTIVEVVSQLLVLGLTVSVRKVVLVKRMLENVLRLHYIHRPAPHTL